MIFFILGAGYFGRLALERLASLQPQAEFRLVDLEPDQCRTLTAPPGVKWQCQVGDAVACLSEILSDSPPTWIIPAIPDHVAWGWLTNCLEPGTWRPCPVPRALVAGLPWVGGGDNGGWYVSLATTPCPDDCPETVSRCRVTNLPRQVNMYKYLEDLGTPEAQVVVVRSRQLAPGVGGYRPEALWNLRSQVQQARGRVYVATACRCHGVIHGLEKIS